MSLDLNKPHMYVVVGMHHDPRMLEYVKNVLGHGGCNVFTEDTLECQNCKATVVASNWLDKVVCPGCGGDCRPVSKESFGQWASEHRGNHTCQFIADSARR